MLNSGTNIFVVVVIRHVLHNVGKVQSKCNHHKAATRGLERLKNFVN